MTVLKDGTRDPRSPVSLRLRKSYLEHLDSQAALKGLSRGQAAEGYIMFAIDLERALEPLQGSLGTLQATERITLVEALVRSLWVPTEPLGEDDVPGVVTARNKTDRNSGSGDDNE